MVLSNTWVEHEQCKLRVEIQHSGKHQGKVAR